MFGKMIRICGFYAQLDFIRIPRYMWAPHNSERKRLTSLDEKYSQEENMC